MDKSFYDSVRSTLFGGSLTQSQIDAMEAIEAAWKTHGNGNLDAFAYVLATIYGEVGPNMIPKSEVLYYTAKRICEVWPSKFKTLAAAAPYAGNPEKLGNKVYAGILGNGDEASGDGYRYRGRGYQTTGRTHYKHFGDKLGVDLIRWPDLLNDIKVAAPALIIGMVDGSYTGKSFQTYLDGVDETDDEDLREFINARRIINGTFNAAAIGGFALKFEHALRAAAPVTDLAKAPVAGAGLGFMFSALLRFILSLIPKKAIAK